MEQASKRLQQGTRNGCKKDSDNLFCSEDLDDVESHRSNVLRVPRIFPFPGPKNVSRPIPRHPKGISRDENAAFSTEALRDYKKFSSAKEKSELIFSTYFSRSTIPYLLKNGFSIVTINPEGEPFETLDDALSALKTSFVATKGHMFDMIGGGSFNNVFSAFGDPTSVIRISSAHLYSKNDIELEEVVKGVAAESVVHFVANRQLPGIFPELKELIAVFFKRKPHYDDDDPKELPNKHVGVFFAQKMERLEVIQQELIFCGVPTGYTASTLLSMFGVFAGVIEDKLKVVREKGDMQTKQVLEMVVKLCSKKFYHGDIHSGNLLMTTKGPRMIDIDSSSCMHGIDIKGVDCSIDTAFGFNQSMQANAPENVFCTKGLVKYGSVQFAKDGSGKLISVEYSPNGYYRVNRIIRIMYILAPNYPEVDLFGSLPHAPSDEYQQVLPIRENVLYLYDKYSDYEKRQGCDFFTMRSQKCKSASLIFSAAITLIEIFLQGRSTLLVDSKLSPLSKNVAKLLIRCLHPLPESRPTNEELQAELERL